MKQNYRQRGCNFMISPEPVIASLALPMVNHRPLEDSTENTQTMKIKFTTQICPIISMDPSTSHTHMRSCFVHLTSTKESVCSIQALDLFKLSCPKVEWDITWPPAWNFQIDLWLFPCDCSYTALFLLSFSHTDSLDILSPTTSALFCCCC